METLLSVLIPPPLYFSDMVTLECSDPEAALTVEVSLGPRPETCPDEYIPQLRIHAYTEEEGWQPLPDQEAHEASGRVSAVDTQARRYALFGPVQYYVAPAADAEPTEP